MLASGNTTSALVSMLRVARLVARSAVTTTEATTARVRVPVLARLEVLPVVLVPLVLVLLDPVGLVDAGHLVLLTPRRWP